MNTTDPQRLREAAANVFIDLLSPEDYLGIITFNNEVDLVISMEQLKDISIRESFKERLSPNLEAGVILIIRLLLKNQVKSYQN